MSHEVTSELDEKVRAFFNAAVKLRDTSRSRFQAQHGLARAVAKRVLPQSRWKELQRAWVRARVRRAVDEVFAEARIREDFTLDRIWRRLGSTGITRELVTRYGGHDWQRRRMDIPSTREKVLAAINRLLSQGVSVGAITLPRACEEAGTKHQQCPWYREMLRTAWQQWQEQGKGAQQQPEDVKAIRSTEGKFDQVADELDLRRGGGRLLRLVLLRPDIAKVAWPTLCEAAMDGQLADSTVSNYFSGYRFAGEVLGERVPDISKASLKGVRAAWLVYEAEVKPLRRALARAALIRLFSQLAAPVEGQSVIDCREMLLIAAWMSLTAHVRREEPCTDHLSDSELDAVIAACLADIKAGEVFLEGEPDLFKLSTRSVAKNNALPIVRWGIALMMLAILLTGLRRQSVFNIRIGDWAELHPGLCALVWRHDKKREERVAVLPTTLARLFNRYAERTQKLRQALNTHCLFLFGTANGHWSPRLPGRSLFGKLKNLVQRHGLSRDGQPLKLNCLIFRRTFVTRELYDGRSLWALQLQLGHRYLETTKIYAKFDVYEHSALVGPALDDHGRRSLTLWHGPVVLDSLDPRERARLLELRTERDQEVGFCRHASCKKIDDGSLPPCSLCEHLVSGREFFGAWDAEQRRREHGLARLESVPGRESELANRRREYALFAANYTRLKREVN